MTGYIQIYTGNGKGKTTAALGLIVRAYGAGLRIYLGQFIKHGDYCEIQTIREHLPLVVIDQFGHGFIMGNPTEKDKVAAQQGLASLRRAMLGGQYDLVIADEINSAINAGVLSVDDVVSLLNEKPTDVEIVLTGRNAHQRLIDKADLVTEMACVKHYFDTGVSARAGIET